MEVVPDASPPSSSSEGSTTPPSTSSGSRGSSDSSNDSSNESNTTASSESATTESTDASGTDNSTTSTSSTSSSASTSDDDAASEGGHMKDSIPYLTAQPIPERYFTDVAFRMSRAGDISPFAEKAIVKEWSTQLGCWVSRNTLVLIYHSSFARGCMRSSYHLIDFQCSQKNFVAKRYRKNTVSVSQYFDDVAMHSIAEYWAMQFNMCDPPKKVRFVPAAVLELCFRNPPLVFAIEPRLEGEFKKHNNNNGYVADDNRCTPQAFSHFTFHQSHGQLMIVDIQGVGDDYTDPQIMSLDGEGYGRGNLGKKGMEKFLKTHECNGVCQQLGLPDIGATSSSVKKDEGNQASSNNEAPKRKKVNKQHPAKKAAGGRASLDYPPQHLPPSGGQDASPPNVRKSQVKRGARQLLRESLKTISSSEFGDAGAVRPPPLPLASVTADYFEGGGESAPVDPTGRWGTLSYVESLLGEDAVRVAPTTVDCAPEAVQPTVTELKAKKKAEKDTVRVDF